ncbi:MAG: metal-dependent hydrolase [Nitrososphaerota archaeon]
MPEPALHFSIVFALTAPRLGVKKALLLSLIALLPDLDILFHVHRSMSHSIVVLSFAFLPILMAVYFFKRNYIGFTLLCLMAVLGHSLMDCFQTYTPILYPALDKSLWIDAGGQLIMSSEGFKLKASVSVKDALTVFEPFEAKDAPIFTSEGFLMSLLLVIVPLFLGVISFRKAVSVSGI